MSGTESKPRRRVLTIVYVDAQGILHVRLIEVIA